MQVMKLIILANHNKAQKTLTCLGVLVIFSSSPPHHPHLLLATRAVTWKRKQSLKCAKQLPTSCPQHFETWFCPQQHIIQLAKHMSSSWYVWHGLKLWYMTPLTSWNHQPLYKNLITYTIYKLCSNLKQIHGVPIHSLSTQIIVRFHHTNPSMCLWN